MNKIARSLFFEKFYVHLAIIIQIAICISFTNYAIAINNTYYSGYKDTYNFEDAEYFMSVDVNVKSKYNKEVFEETDSIIEFYYPVITLKEYNIYAYEQKTFERYCDKYMIKGEYKHSDNEEINCVVVGDKSMYNKDVETTINSNNYKFHISGILNSKTKMINSAISGVYATSGELFEEFDNSKINIICLVEDIDEIYNGYSLNSGLVYFGDNSNSAREEIIQYGFLIAMDDIRSNNDSSDSYVAIRVFSYLSVGLGIVGLISMLGMFYLNIKQNESVFLTFNKLGLRKDHIVIISSLYMLYFYALLIPISIILTKIYTLILYIPIPLKIDARNWIFIFTAMLIIYVINVVTSLIIFKVGEKNE